MMAKVKHIAVLILLILLFFAIYWHFDLGHYLTFSYLKSNQELLSNLFLKYPLRTAIVFSSVYVITAALSLPGATILTLAAGAIFGLFYGTLIASFASSIGATLAFLGSRFLFRSIVEKKFADRIEKINQGIRREGKLYLFSIRMIPAIPFFLVNLSMGLTKINVLTFYLISQLGMFAGTFVYVNAGTQLSKLDSIEGIFSFEIIVSFTLLGLAPFFSRWIIDSIRKMQKMKRYPKPKIFDYNLMVIGAGSGGLVAAYIASTVKAKVALIEKHKMGGDCLNTGCIPSKALIKSAKVSYLMQKAKNFGIFPENIQIDFSKVMERVQSVIEQVAPHDSIERYTDLGVDCIQGDARILSPYEVEVNGKILKTRSIIVASGASPLVPKIPGIEAISYYTSDTIWQIRDLPKHLLVLGGGAIGCELAQSFARLGSKVTIIEKNAHLMEKEDTEVSILIEQCFQSESITVLTSHTALEFQSREGKNVLLCDSEEGQKVLEFDHAILALGRKANTSGFGLEELGVELNPNGTIAVNEYLQTTQFSNIYACGDVAGPYQFTHTASHQAWFASVNALFGYLKKFKVNYRVIPWCTFIDPEVAHVGLNEKEACAKKISYDVTKYEIDDLDRAIADGATKGFVKVLTKKGSDKILGATIVSANAGELITEFVSAMKHNYGLNKILNTIHIYPTYSEANKFTAGEWKRKMISPYIMSFLQKLHSLRR